MTSGDSSLNDAFKALKVNGQPRRSGPKCRVAVLSDSMDEETRTTFLEVMAMEIENVTHVKIATELISRGYEITANSIMRHRHRQTAGGCRCPK